MGCNVMSQYTYIMHNDQIKVISISMSSNIYHVWGKQLLGSPNYFENFGSGQDQVMRGQGERTWGGGHHSPMWRERGAYGALPCSKAVLLGWGVMALWSPTCWQSPHLVSRAGIKEGLDPLWAVPARQNADRWRCRGRGAAGKALLFHTSLGSYERLNLKAAHE